MVPIGEKVLFQPPDKKKWGPQFVYGIYLGIDQKSNCTLIGDATDVHKCNSWKRVPDEDKWDGDLMAEIKGFP